MATNPPFICLFCLSTTAKFTKIEHPIPESLGNDDLTIPPGFVCDKCNEYFGTKVENFVINAPPFSLERLRSNVKNKKSVTPPFLMRPHVEIHPTGWRNRVVLVSSSEYWQMAIRTSKLLLPHIPKNDFLLVRLLLKIGLELLLNSYDIDPYNSDFNEARYFARSPRRN